ncbi:MAG: hypothetical protein LBG89_00990 [Rickettsiales bacterium]|jgi:hypothetical protein|nr:hypothetical protein [Rickettsiales bacterium]
MLCKKYLIAALLSALAAPVFADDINLDEFDAEGSVFLRITALEQDKVLMRLEKERAQLALDLSRIEAEKSRLAGSESAPAGDASAELAAQFDEERRKMNEELERFRRQLDEVKTAPREPADAPARAADVAAASDDGEFDIADHYRLVHITGTEGNLKAMVEIVANGHRQRVGEGHAFDGFVVQGISSGDGVRLERDGEVFQLRMVNAAR